MDLPLILVILTILTAIVWLVDKKFFEQARKAKKQKEPWWVDYSRSFFPVFLAVLVIRSFIFQLYHVPSGSLVPSVLPGDLIFSTQYSYGLKLPLTGTNILPIGKPKRGDIAIFPSPPNPKINFIKRIIGLPGDHITYKDHQLTINGKKVEQKIIGPMAYITNFPGDRNFQGQLREEYLPGKTHQILINPTHAEDTAAYDFTVPKGYYFAMGDDRDDSADSRMWGFVPANSIQAKARFVLFSWDPIKHHVRWSRIGKRL
jgi:signal peptidase I